MLLWPDAHKPERSKVSFAAKMEVVAYFFSVKPKCTSLESDAHTSSLTLSLQTVLRGFTVSSSVDELWTAEVFAELASAGERHRLSPPSPRQRSHFRHYNKNLAGFTHVVKWRWFLCFTLCCCSLVWRYFFCAFYKYPAAWAIKWVRL